MEAAVSDETLVAEGAGCQVGEARAWVVVEFARAAAMVAEEKLLVHLLVEVAELGLAERAY